MKILEYDYKQNNDYVTALFQSANIAFIDIETDGLSHKNKIVLIGLVIFSSLSKKAKVIQLFNDDYQSERDLLKQLFIILEMHNIQYYVSFNGDSFDFPFMNARLRALKLNRYLDKRFNIDLLRVVRKNKNLFPFESYTLKSVERFVGIDRTDTISGKDSVILYQSYIETKDPKLEEIILLHNYDDILNMVPLLNIYKNIPFAPLYKPCPLSNKVYYITSVDMKRDYCEVTLGMPYKDSQIEFFYESIGASMSQSNDHLLIKFETNKLKLKDSQGTITILNTRTVFKQDFTSLSSHDKQDYLIEVNQDIHWDNLIHLIQRIYLDFTT